jgi:hypothetical protein
MVMVLAPLKKIKPKVDDKNKASKEIEEKQDVAAESK